MLEDSTRKWEYEWKEFCDHVQDMEEERLDFVKDNIWIYANAVSSVCVTDDESCEQVRVALEGFEAVPEVEAFVKNFGTGGRIPDPPLFVDYSKGDAYLRSDASRTAHFSRTSNRAAIASMPIDTKPDHDEQGNRTLTGDEEETHSPVSTMQRGPTTNGTSLVDQGPVQSRSPVGGIPMPGMASAVTQADQHTPSMRSASPAPPPVSDKPARPPSAFSGRPQSAYGSHATPAPTGPSAIRPSPSMAEDDDPIARSLAELRRDPPPAGSIRRGHSIRRPESVVSTHPASRQSYQQPPRSPGPGATSSVGHGGDRTSYQTHPAGRPSMDTGLIPPMAGHTAADLARSREEHAQRTSRAFSPAPGGQSQDYSSAAANIVGAHPASRPGTPLGQHPAPPRAISPSAPRAPSPAFMQPPAMAPSPVDEVLGQYHQAFPGERERERSRSRAGSFTSTHSRPQSYAGPDPSQMQRSASPAPREGFVGIGAGRSPSPQPQQFQQMPPAGAAMGASQSASHARGQSYSSMGPSSAQSQQRSSFVSPTSPPVNQSPYQQQQPMQQPPRPSSTVSPPLRNQDYGSTPTLNQYGSVNSLAQSQQNAHPPQQQYARQQQQQHAATPSSPYGQHPSGSSIGHGGSHYHAHQNSQNAPPGPSPAPHQAPYGQNNAPQQQYNAPTSSSSHQQHLNQDPRYRPTSTQPAGSPYQQNTQNRSASPAPQALQQPPYQQQQQQQPPYQYQPPPQQYQPVPQAQQQAQPYANQYTRAASPAPHHQQHQQQAPPPQQQPFNRSPSPVPPQPPADAPPTGQYSTTGEPVMFCESKDDWFVSLFECVADFFYICFQMVCISQDNRKLPTVSY